MLKYVPVTLSLTALIAVLSFAAPQAEAKPPFAAKEGKPCSYCHTTPSGGKRNYRGQYYHDHNLTFAEFDDEAEAKKAGEPIGPEPDPKPKSWTAPKGAEAPAKPEEKPAEEKKVSVKDAAAKVKAAEAALKAAPKDAAKKKALAAATAELGHATMLDQSIPPRKRYPEALRLARKALTLDPANKVAAEDKKAIEDAYKSMGKPVPTN